MFSTYRAVSLAVVLPSALPPLTAVPKRTMNKCIVNSMVAE